MSIETNGYNGNEHRVSIVYDAPFWIALFESFWEGAYSVAREVIGTSEPTTSEIILFFERLDWQRLHYTCLLYTSPSPRD